MKSNRILIVSLILLAILTIGSVSASEDISTDTANMESDENTVNMASDDNTVDIADENTENIVSDDVLAADDTGEDSISSSIDDSAINENEEDLIADDGDSDSISEETAASSSPKDKNVLKDESNSNIDDILTSDDDSDEETIDDILTSDDGSDEVNIDIDKWQDLDLDSDEDFAWIHIPVGVTEGRALVSSEDATLFEEDINFDDGTHWSLEDDGHYVCSFAPSSLRNLDKLYNGAVVTFAFLNEYNEILGSQSCIVYLEEVTIRFEESYYPEIEVGIHINDNEYFPISGANIDKEFAVISIPYDVNAFIVVSCEDNEFFNKGVNEFADNKKEPDLDDDHYINYFISPKDVNFFAGLENDNEITISVYDEEHSLINAKKYRIKFEDEYFSLKEIGEDEETIDEITFELIAYTVEEFDEISDSVLVAYLYVPEDDNIDFAAAINVTKNGEEFAIINTTNLYPTFNGAKNAYQYNITLDMTDVQDKDIFGFTVDCLDDFSTSMVVEKIDDAICQYEFEEIGIEFYAFFGNITLGDIDDPNAMGPHPWGEFLRVNIPDKIGVTEGTITISNGKSIIFTASLEELTPTYEYGFLGNHYYINLDEFDWTILSDNKNLTFTFTSGDTVLLEKRIKIDDYVYRVLRAEEVFDLFEIRIFEDDLTESDSTVVIISPTEKANPQTVAIDLGLGYFSIYVNGERVENLGGFIEDDEEALTELEVDRLCGPWFISELELTLDDLGIDASGYYNIRITHYPSVFGGLDDRDDDADKEYAQTWGYVIETELLNRTIAVELEGQPINNSGDPENNGTPTDPNNNGTPTDPENNGTPTDPNNNGTPTGTNGNETSAKQNKTAKLATKLTAPKVSTTYYANKKLVVTLKDSKGHVLSNKKISIKVGSISKTYKTNAKGKISVSVGTLVPKKYTAAVKFAGDKKFKASSLKVRVVVSKAKPKMKYKNKLFKTKAKVKKLTVNLVNRSGKAIKNAKVTLRVNKKTYTAKTNKKGVASFKVKNITEKGKYSAVARFKGNKYYKGVNKKVRFTVKD